MIQRQSCVKLNSTAAAGEITGPRNRGECAPECRDDRKTPVHMPLRTSVKPPSVRSRVDGRQPNERRRTRRANAAYRSGWRRSYPLPEPVLLRSLLRSLAASYSTAFRVGRPSIHDFRRASQLSEVPILVKINLKTPEIQYVLKAAHVCLYRTKGAVRARSWSPTNAP